MWYTFTISFSTHFIFTCIEKIPCTHIFKLFFSKCAWKFWLLDEAIALWCINRIWNDYKKDNIFCKFYFCESFIRSYWNYFPDYFPLSTWILCFGLPVFYYRRMTSFFKAHRYGWKLAGKMTKWSWYCRDQLIPTTSK